MEHDDIPFWSLLDLMICSVRNPDTRARLKVIRAALKTPGDGVSRSEREWVIAAFRSNKKRIEEAYRATERAKASMATGKTLDRLQAGVREVQAEEDRKRRFEQDKLKRRNLSTRGKFGF